jgi:hypothetical protein
MKGFRIIHGAMAIKWELGLLWYGYVYCGEWEMGMGNLAHPYICDWGVIVEFSSGFGNA